MGNFLSAVQTSGISRQADELRNHLAQLADMIAEYPQLSRCPFDQSFFLPPFLFLLKVGGAAISLLQHTNNVYYM
jgi:hypothetical protein